MTKSHPPRGRRAAPAPPAAAAPAAAPQDGPSAASGPPDGVALVVGIGASAGGLAALEALLEDIALDHMAFVVLQHLQPDMPSSLPELLGRRSHVRVLAAPVEAEVRANHVYVLPPNAELVMQGNTLRLLPRDTAAFPHLPIDSFLRSLAEAQGPRAVAVLLSGTGTDGTDGFRAIKAAGGLTFVQQPESAGHAGMPRSALESGCADFCLTPKQIADELNALGRRGRVQLPPLSPDAPARAPLAQLLRLVRGRFGVDFGEYKLGTVERRIERRMVVQRCTRLEDYVALVGERPAEVAALYNDILISVTEFYRDPHAFEGLEATVWPRLVGAAAADAAVVGSGGAEPLRLWVAGCATGEEAYSLAISLAEYAHHSGRAAPVQVFATDIADESIDLARRGVYPPAAVRRLGQGRLNRYFTRRGPDYRVCREIRDQVIFSRHNLLRDAPFSRIGLVSCRNLLIYLQAAAQQRVLRVLHYALQPGGLLLLGSSESVGDIPEMFSLVDRRAKIYVKRAMATLGAARDVHLQVPSIAAQRPPSPRPTASLGGVVERRLLELYAPPGVIVNDALDVLHFRGAVGPFLAPSTGAASFHLMRLVRPELHAELKRLVAQARAERRLCRAHVHYRDGEAPGFTELSVVPVEEPQSGAPCLLVLFRRQAEGAMADAADAAGGAAGGGPGPPPRHVDGERLQALERELASTRDYLQTTVEEKESSNEELKAANEELQSSNEELQSTNEELETSKEELQSSNEELTTVNDELSARMGELGLINDDLHNLLAGIDSAIVMAGMDLRIRRYTAAAERLFNMVPADIGREVGYLDKFLPGIQVGPRMAEVVAHLAPFESEVIAENGRWYALRIAPYRTLDHTIRGAVLSVVNIDLRRAVEQSRRDVAGQAERVLGPLGLRAAVVDAKLRLVWASPACYALLGRPPGTPVDLGQEPLVAGRAADTGLRRRLKHALMARAPFAAVLPAATLGAAGGPWQLHCSCVDWLDPKILLLLNFSRREVDDDGRGRAARQAGSEDGPDDEDPSP